MRFLKVDEIDYILLLLNINYYYTLYIIQTELLQLNLQEIKISHKLEVIQKTYFSNFIIAK